MSIKKNKSVYRPKVVDVGDALKTRTQRLAEKKGLRVDFLQSKIYETGLALLEKQVPAEE